MPEYNFNRKETLQSDFCGGGGGGEIKSNLF